MPEIFFNFAFAQCFDSNYDKETSMKRILNLNNKTILVTGSPGFIGANLVCRLLNEMEGGQIVSLDNMNDYYDPSLKEYRLELIEEAARNSKARHKFLRGSIANKELVDDIFKQYRFDIVSRRSRPCRKVLRCRNVLRCRRHPS